MKASASALILAILAACGGSGGSGAGATPEETFNTAKAAAEKGDFRGMFGVFDPQEQDLLLAAMLIGGGFVTMGKKEAADELKAIQDKHGVKEPDTQTALTDEESMRKAAAAAFAGVKDRGQYFADMVAFMEKHSDKGSKSIPDQIKGSNLKDVKIEGDRASATVVRSDGKENEIGFVRREGKWYMGPRPK